MNRFLSASLMIVVGALIYIFSRRDIIFFSWVPEPVIETMRLPDISRTSLPIYFIVYCLPDGLWYGALLILQSIFLRKTFLSQSLFALSVSLPFVLEILQIRKDVPGTFDPMDLITYFVTLSVFVLFSYNYNCYGH